MLTIYFSSDARYKVERLFVKEYLQKEWQKRGLPEGIVSISFVGNRKASTLAKKYLNDTEAHPVLTFPYASHERTFPESTEGDLVAEIVVCYPQVTIYAAEQEKEINKVIAQFLDHALTILSNKLPRSAT